jgi:hypothetical protein
MSQSRCPAARGAPAEKIDNRANGGLVTQRAAVIQLARDEEHASTALAPWVRPLVVTRATPPCLRAMSPAICRGFCRTGRVRLMNSLKSGSTRGERDALVNSPTASVCSCDDSSA